MQEALAACGEQMMYMMAGSMVFGSLLAILCLSLLDFMRARREGKASGGGK